MPLFSVILTVLIKENVRKHFQDLFRRTSGKPNFFYVFVLKTSIFRTSKYHPREEL